MLLEQQRTSLDLTFRVARFPVRVNPLFWLSMALIGLPFFDAGLHIGLLFVACGFVSVLWHELGHASAMRYYGSPAYIELFAFGGVAVATYSSQSPYRRMAIAAAGPAAGLVLLGLVWGTNQLIPWSDGPPIVKHLYTFLFFINLFWTLINLLPIWPLDGSKILREVFVLRRLRAPDYTTQQVSLVTALVLAGVGLIVNFGPRELRVQIFETWPSWLSWAIPSPIMMIFMFLMAYQSYEMMKRTRKPRLFAG